MIIQPSSLQCIYCNRISKSFHSHNAHQIVCPKNSNRVLNRYPKYGICVVCGNQTSYFLKKTCSKDCLKKRTSINAKIRMKEHPEQFFWSHSNKFKSHPCEKLKETLIQKNIRFVEEYQPLSERLYAIDIAFPDIKLGIEVNGSQHYNPDGSLREYYQKRHDQIEQSGWKLIELHYTTCYNQKFLNEIDQWLKIGDQPDYTMYFNKKLQREFYRYLQTIIKSSQQKIKNYLNLKQNYQQRNSIYKRKPNLNSNGNFDIVNIIQKANIDFSSLGWISKVCQITGKSHTHIREWLKKYMPAEYEQCFKRLPYNVARPVLRCVDCNIELKFRGYKDNKIPRCYKCACKESGKRHSGENASSYGNVWVYSTQEKRAIQIKKDQLESYYQQGWIKGRK